MPQVKPGSPNYFEFLINNNVLNFLSAPPHKKKPLNFVEGLRGSYWIRTSDLFHVKEAL
jgi:hypothetical protein